MHTNVTYVKIMKAQSQQYFMYKCWGRVKSSVGDVTAEEHGYS